MQRGAPSPSPRIEITPSGDPHQTHPLDASPRTTALTVPGYENTAYREPQSPASSNSSTGWLSEAYSPWVSPCVSPSGGGGVVGLTALDLLPGLQGIHTSSAHSSPGTSPRTSITEETFLVPQRQRSSSPHSHNYPRSRSASPQGKRTYDQYSGPNLGTTSQQQQRSRSPSPSPSPHHPQGRPLAQTDPQANAPQQMPSVEEVLSSLNSSLSSSMPRAVPSKMVRPSVECYTYGESQGEHGQRGRAGAETFYILPTSFWPASLAHGAFRYNVQCALVMMIPHKNEK